jgi:hypothetical protein
MATLQALVNDESLLWLDPEFPDGEVAHRRIYVTPKAAEWIEKTLPKIRSQWETKITAEEQFWQLVDEFCGGVTISYPQGFHHLRPADAGVWELKTPDLRLFGWFYRKDVFIISKPMDANFVKDHDLYRGCRDEVRAFRDAFNLDAPKHVEGDDPNDVITGIDFA